MLLTMTKETVESKKKLHDNLCQKEASLNSYCSACTLFNILKYFQQGFQERLVNIIWCSSEGKKDQAEPFTNTTKYKNKSAAL